MALWIRYDTDRNIWEVAGTDTQQVFQDLLEHHPRETKFARWIEMQGYVDARPTLIDQIAQPNRRRFYKGAEGQKSRIRSGIGGREIASVLPYMSQAPPVSGSGTGRIYFNGTKFQVSENGGAWGDLVGGSGATQGCYVTNSTNTNLAHTTPVMMTFDSETYDTDTMHSTSVNTGRITINTSGKYHIGFLFSISNSGAAALSTIIWIFLNGSTIALDGRYHGGNAGYGTLSLIKQLVATDYIEVQVMQSNASSATEVISGGVAYSSVFFAQRVA